MVSRRKQGTRRLVVVCGLAMVLASQVASGMPLEQQPRQDQYIIARAPQAVVKGLVNDAVVTVTAAAASATGAVASKTVVAAAASSTASVRAAATSATSASASAAASSSASSSQSLPAVTPVAGASVSTSTSDSTSTSGASTSTSTSAAASKSIFNPHNKLFPAAVAGCVGIVVGVMLILITIGKCYAHAHMTPEEKAGEYGDYYKKSKDGGLAIRGAKSLRRAFTTSKKLGSFARRNQEGSVLIDVGDEVYAVTQAVAQEYERERSAMGGSSGGSRLTVCSKNASPLRQALKNAEMNVAASRAGEARPTSQQLVQSWRDQNGASQTQGNQDVLSRSISQKLTDGLRAFRGQPIGGASLTTGTAAYSFDSEKQDMGSLRQAEVPATAYLPVITRGAKEWDIRPRQETNQYLQHTTLQSKSSQSSLSSSNLSHERHTLTDAPVPRLESQTQPRSQPAHPERRPKSILIKRDAATQPDAGYRHRKPVPREGEEAPAGVQRSKTSRSKPLHSSTSAASPKMLQHRTTASHDTSPVFLKPSKPAASRPESNGPQTREIFRPLPLPPA